MASSDLAKSSKKLRISKEKLGSREIGDITDELHGEVATVNRRLRNQVKDKRRKLKKRLRRLGSG
jgi:hypothetical protein